MADLDMPPAGTVSENAVQVGSQIFVGTTKAHKQRSVPPPEFLLPHRLGNAKEGPRQAGVPGDDGKHLWRSHNGSGWFDEAVNESGVPRVTATTAAHRPASVSATMKAVQRMLRRQRQ